MRLAAYLLLGVALWGASQAMAQNGVSGANVTVQLPNFSVFGVNTSVLVPDSGPSPYARYRQLQYNRATYGPFRQRAFGAQRGAAIGAATAQIHDARATDDALLRASRARRTNWARGSTASRFESLQTASGGSLQSVAAIEHRKAIQRAEANREAQALVEKARGAHRDGKSGVATIYYNMAAKQASERLAAEIRAEAARLKAAAIPSTARRDP